MQMHRALATMLRGQQSALAACRPVETSVEYETDPNVPGRTAVRIVGATREAVQYEITRCMGRAESMGNSFCQFLNPGRLSDGTWSSRGEIVVSVPAEETVG